MILVTLGTQDKKFYRLLDAIQREIDKGNIKDEVIVQAGCSCDYKSKDMKIFDLIPMDEFNNLINKCDLLITHGGVGSIVTGLKCNKKVIAVARLKEYKEHTNNHQLQIVENFTNSGYILSVDNMKDLGKTLKKSKKFIPKKYEDNNKNFCKFIDGEIECQLSINSSSDMKNKKSKYKKKSKRKNNIKNILCNILKYIKNNKFLLLMILMLFTCLCYCHFNTFLANDDLPYSFFKRLDQRVTNLFQIIWDNLRYYKSTNGRFLIHCIVMLLLMFGKNLWALLNPLVIICIIFIIVKLSSSNNKFKNIISFLLASSLFLMMFNFKSLIYWVAGSVNYLWVCCYIFVFIYLYLKKNIFTHKKTTMCLIFILSMLHECSFAFSMIFILTLITIDYLKNKKIVYLKYLIPVILGGCILLLAPGNLARNNDYTTWYSLSFFERLNISIPFVSNNIFKLFNLENLIPTIYILVVLLKNISLKQNNLLNKVIKQGFCIFIVIISILLANSIFKYSGFLLAIVVFLLELYIHISEKKYEFIPVSFGFYAVAFSVIITPLYDSLRPNLLIDIYFIMMICIYIQDIISNKRVLSKVLLIFTFILLILLTIYEILIYYNIGMIQSKRIDEIREYKNNSESEILYLSKVPDEYSIYHQDCNVVDENFWTYKWYTWYYEIPEGTLIRYK